MSVKDKAIPISKNPLTELVLPFFTGLKAGFPSPAADFLDSSIDLVKLLVPRPSSTYLMRVSGDSMKGAGIMDESIVIVDRSIKPESGKIYVCYLDGEFTVKRILFKNNKCVLYAANKNYQPIVPDEESNLILWGAVTYSINPMKCLHL